MEVEKDKIKDLFSSKLGSFEPEVPASVWGGLDQLLSNQPPVQTESTSSGSTSGAGGNTSLLKVIAIIVGLAIAIAAGIYLLSPDKEETKIEVPQKKEDKKEIIIDSLLEEEIAPDLPAPVSKVDREVKENVRDEKPDLQEEKVEIKEELKEELKQELKQEPKQEYPQKKDPIIEKEDNKNYVTTIVPKDTEDYSSKFLMKAYVDLGFFDSQRKGMGADFLFSKKIRGKDFIEALSTEGSEAVLEHKRPISVGLLVGKKIAPKLFIETGLVYSYLSSDMRSNSRFMIKESQSFNYLGIPFYINYNFYKLGKTELNVSFGGMLQKDIKGQYVSHMGLAKPENENSTENGIFYKEPYYIKKSIKQSNPQLSLRTNLEVIHPLYKKLYIYGAIGGTYYFDANNKYRTIYSDKDVQFNLNLGIKYDF